MPIGRFTPIRHSDLGGAISAGMDEVVLGTIQRYFKVFRIRVEVHRPLQLVELCSFATKKRLATKFLPIGPIIVEW